MQPEVAILKISVQIAVLKSFIRGGVSLLIFRTASVFNLRLLGEFFTLAVMLSLKCLPKFFSLKFFSSFSLMLESYSLQHCKKSFCVLHFLGIFRSHVYMVTFSWRFLANKCNQALALESEIGNSKVKIKS